MVVSRLLIFMMALVLVGNAIAITTCSPADQLPADGVVDINELKSYIAEWKAGDVTITQLMEAIGEWKNGCPNSKKVFASYMVWNPIWIFHDNQTELLTSRKDASMYLSSMLPCDSIEDRDAGKCWTSETNWWKEAPFIEDYKTEITDAIEHGIDGFILYLVGNKSMSIPENLGRMLTAAEEASTATGKHFEIMYAPDLTHNVTLENFTGNLITMLTENKDHQHLYKENGRIALNGYLNDKYTPNEWETIIQALKESGIEIAVTGHIYPNYRYQWEINDTGEQKIRDYMTVFEGLSLFQPNLRQEHQGTLSQFKQILDSEGKEFIPQVHPGYYSTFIDGRGNWYVDRDLSRFFRDNWELAISLDTDIINIVTWNDYLENHHIASSVHHNQAYLDITKWYSHLHKHGEPPIVDETRLYLGHYDTVFTQYPIDIEVVGLVSDEHDGLSCNLSVTCRIGLSSKNSNFVLRKGIFAYEETFNGCGSDATISLECGSFVATSIVKINSQYEEYKWHTDSELEQYNCNHGCGRINLTHAADIDMSTIFTRII